MNADEARELTKPRTSIDLIYELIIEACNKGRHQARIGYISDEDCTTLESEGFFIFCGSGDPGAPLSINWKLC